MTLENIYYIGQTVAAIAILASLIFVGLQVRQNTRAQRAAAQEALFAQKFTHMSLIIADRQVAELHRKGLKDLHSLDEIDRWRFGALMQQLFDMTLTFQRNRDAFVDTDSGEQAMYTLTRPGAVMWWSRARVLYPKAFQGTVDSWIQEAEALRAASEGEAAP